MPVDALYRNDFTLASCDAVVTSVHQDGTFETDRTCFYATSGGQPGDTGIARRADGSAIALAVTRHGETKDIILHVPAEGETPPAVGDRLRLEIDWPRRLKLMRMHTACHLLSVVCPYPITGASVGEEESRVDFDMSETIDKDAVTAAMMKLVAEDHPVYVQWITDEELAANPGIVKSKNVRPPMGMGRISLIAIGENASVDSQPCGGTHVRSTGEVGGIHIGKIEKKGRENRRFRIRFDA
ncbi:alanyl-tRNA editing protein [Martelella mediterranea]|uniref:Alanine--tRNA ligase n=1 Tax=Martelella mediterranea DSM 17316 TaxID=1122214 RepID=A0A1U9Z2L9_9HYPH|nr:alanyl-tRNA editing protein [Martelella mediterranea]AQZ51852.1 Alanine--tRNA ligase [Martelella mediterranea DSM 17316]